MNKEYHYTLSRTDRICLIAFVVILLGWELIKEVLPRRENAFTFVAPPSEHHGYKARKKFNYSNNNYPKKYFPSYSKTYEKKYSSYEEEQETSPPSAPLSIMTATFAELTSMGLSKKVAYNIQKFISSGGIIANDHDLMKIYGMDSIQLISASPFIIYGTLSATPILIAELKEEPTSKPPGKMIDINKASIADLESLEGIGEVLAKRIIKYRESIGGFLNPEQLKECYGIPPETIEKIKDQITVSGSPHFISINEVNLDSLKHPYLNKKIIRLIKAYKNQHGNFKNESAFRKIYPPDSNWCNKVLPYISFE